MTLKNGTETEDPRLDRLYEEDLNSLNFPVTLKLEEKAAYESYIPTSFAWPVDETLDQGQEGACVGFGFTHDALAYPNVVRSLNGESLDAKFAREKIYWEAQKIDEWPGGSYPGATPVNEGSSVLSGAKIMTQLGLYTKYFWALDLKQMALAVGYDGPAILGITMYAGMMEPDEKHFIHATGKAVGGHCILCRGVQIIFTGGERIKTWEDVDKDGSYFILHNSWGPAWGDHGDAYLSLTDMERLINEKAEVCIPARAN